MSSRRSRSIRSLPIKIRGRSRGSRTIGSVTTTTINSGSSASRSSAPGGTLTSLIKRISKGQAETKCMKFYQNLNTTGLRNDIGAFVTRGFTNQNNEIVNNATDILQLLPPVAQGTEDNQRLGNQISPVSLRVKGVVRLRPDTIITNTQATNIKLVIYVLQHVSLKDYENLYASNDFTQLLNDGNNNTVAFRGNVAFKDLEVSKQYYKVLKRKILTLRYSGAQPLGSATNVSIDNSHSWYAEYSFNLGKHLPKKLKYPEQLATPASSVNFPTNSAPFMCMGYYDFKDPNDLTLMPTTSYTNQYYETALKYKDM